ncbi:MAG: non-ribosomal peptide synthetase [Candidatus Promineifilaceae bacterium]
MITKPPKPKEFIPFPKWVVSRTIHGRFENIVATRGNATAIKFGSTAVTYAQLNQQANQIAHTLLSQCGEDNAPVILLAPQGPHIITAVLAALKAGKIWTAVSPNLPAPKQQAIVTAVSPQAIITFEPYHPLALSLAESQTAIINGNQTIASETAVHNPIRHTPITNDTPTHIIFTSGSTGKPKGVVHTHKSTLHYIWLHTNTLYIHPKDHISQLASINYQAGLSDTFRALLNGATLYPYSLTTNGTSHIANWLQQEKITILHTVPTVFRHLMQTVPDNEQFSHMRLVHLGGEAVLQPDVILYRQHFPPSCTLLHNLGSSEVSTYRSYFINHHTPLPENGVLPVGYAVPDKDVFLVDEVDHLVPTGQIGQIVVRSPYLAQGYWQNPALTAEKFKPDPQNAASRLFYTGDLGKMTEDGCLTHLGRNDRQVQIRGMRIELGEIEAALRMLPNVKETAVTSYQPQPGNTRLIAFIVPKNTNTARHTNWRIQLASTLPNWMIPAHYILLDTLPQTDNGKIDYPALPLPNPETAVQNTPYEPPRTQTEATLITIWGQLFPHTHRIGVHHNFFELGGHSLLATRMIAMLQDQLQLTLPLATIFEAPTIAALADTIETIRWLQLGPPEESTNSKRGIL